MAARRFGVRLIATFGNGLIMEHSQGVPLTYEMSIDQNLYPIVAKQLGKMHRDLKEDTALARLRKDKAPYQDHVFGTLWAMLKEIKGKTKQNGVALASSFSD